MARVTELRVRADWQLVRFFYLPALGVGATPFHPCALCIFCLRWGHHVEEWIGRKRLFQITATGLRFEDGGRAHDYQWSDISDIVLRRRNRTPIWRTNGNIHPASPAFWLSVTVREGGDFRTICVWPRQVVGGLFSLMRFAKELQRQLIGASDRGEIPSLLPSVKGLSI